MTSWVYILSQFTPEALLFEALIIVLLCCGYTVFWILRKRRFGIVESNLPSGPVKAYLNELIANAEQLRNQLFGILSNSPPLPQVKKSIENFSINLPNDLAGDPNLALKLAQFEEKL